MGEVLDWFGATDLSFVRGLPSLKTGGHVSEAGLFSPESPGTGFDRMLVQGTQIWQGSKEGGFFLMIGKKSRPSAPLPASRARALTSL